jgi:peptidoglycan hydrolase CwlO-like protein
MKDQWHKDLMKHQSQLDDWVDKELDLNNQLSEKDEEIAKMRKEIEDLKKEL